MGTQRTLRGKEGTEKTPDFGTTDYTDCTDQCFWSL
jgi:hypothetical protein